MKNNGNKTVWLVVLSLVGLAACVGRSENMLDQSVLGYMEYRDDIQKNVLIGRDLLSYHAPDFDEQSFFPPGSKWLIYCTADMDNQPEGYKEVTLNGEPLPFIDGVFCQSADTLLVLDNEQPVKKAKGTLFQNLLYVTSLHMDSIGQQNKVELFYSEKDTLVHYVDRNVYTLYVRSFQEAAAQDTLMEEITLCNTFDLSSFLAAKRALETDTFYIQLKYLTNVSKGESNSGSPVTPTEKDYIPVK